MRLTRIAALTLALGGLAACQQGRNQPPFTSADSLAVDSIRMAWQAAFNAGNAAAVADLYDSNAVNMQGDQPTQTGHDAILAAITAQLAATPRMTINIGGATHFAAMGSVAIAVGQFQMMSADSANPMTLPGKYLVVARKGRDGKWRLRFDHSSMDAPMPAPPPPPARRR